MYSRYQFKPIFVFAIFFVSGGTLLRADEARPSPQKMESPPLLQVIKIADQPWYEAEDKAVAREIASPRNSKAERMSIAEIIIPAGVEVVPHHHLMEEVYYIVSGSGTMMVDDETAVVQAGESVVIAPHQWHTIRNHTDEELRMIVTCAPSWAPEHLIFERDERPEE